MVNKTIKTLLITALLAGAGALFYKKVYIPKSTYDYVVAQKGDMNLTLFGIATVSARELHPVGSNYGGKIVEILKDVGERVHKGELIARFDTADLPKQLEEARERMRSAHFSKIAAMKELDSLRAKLKLVELDYERYKKLKSEGFVSESEYDKVATDLESTLAQIAASEARIRSQKAQKQQAQKNIEALEERLKRMSLYAPIDGIVVSRDAQPSQTVTPQQAILTIVDPAEVWVRATIDERISGDIKKGQSALIRLRSRSDEAPLAGEVARIEAVSDPVTEERIVDLRFSETPIPFHLNEQAEVEIRTGILKDSIIIPSRVIVDGGVWVYRDKRARFRKIEILGRNGTNAAVKGLDANDRILVPNPHKKPLFDGATVRL
jgi:RND family efflux transporter MFP subunit